MEFLHDVLAVRYGGGEAYVELISNFLVDIALAEKYSYFYLAGR